MDQILATPGSSAWSDIKSWRVKVRKALIKERLGCGRELRQSRSERARQRLQATVDLGRYSSLGIYSPMRGEIDIQDLAAELAEGGVRLGLPVVVEKDSAVEFWHWRPGMPMKPGIWNIPVPAERELFEPEALIVPLVGFDSQLFRLGYGGGYYDRTLARACPKPYCIGFGYESGRLPTVFPQPHDIPMDLIVTDDQVHRRADIVNRP
jgi:5-formyltetrahydrofolate cyclo-ligase